MMTTTMLVMHMVAYAIILVGIVLVLWGWAINSSEKNLRRFIGGDIYNHPLVGMMGSKPVLRFVGIPNMMGFFRFAAGPVAGAIYLWQPFEMWSNLAALVLWVPAVLTDVFDGPIARRRGETTAFGEKFDAVADKSVQYLPAVGLAIALARGDVPELWTRYFMIVCFVVILLRELVLLVVWRYTHTDPKPHWVSKLRSFLMAGGIAVVALYLAVPSVGDWAVTLVVGMTVVVACLSVMSVAVETAKMFGYPVD